MQRRSLLTILAAVFGFAAAAKAAEPKQREDVLIAFNRGKAETLLSVRFTDAGAVVAPGSIPPHAASDRLVVPPKSEEWTERKARALTLGESLLDHIQHLHNTGKA